MIQHENHVLLNLNGTDMILFIAEAMGNLKGSDFAFA